MHKYLKHRCKSDVAAIKRDVIEADDASKFSCDDDAVNPVMDVDVISGVICWFVELDRDINSSSLQEVRCDAVGNEPILT